MTREQYTHGHHPSVLRSHAWRTIANSAAYLESELSPGSSLLDIGCGPGTITVEFADRVAPGRVVGLDASAEVIRQADALGADRANLEFVVGSAYDLPFPDDTFDIVHAHQTLQHLADPVAVLREMRRVVRPGGIVAARDTDYAGIFWFPQSPGMDAWIDLYAKVHRSNGGEPNAGRHLKAWALDAGFADVATTASAWNFSDATDRAWWGGLWADRVLLSSFAEDAVAKGMADRAELEHISSAWREWAASDAGWILMPQAEILCRS